MRHATLFPGCHWLRQCRFSQSSTNNALAKPVVAKADTKGFTLLEIILSLAILAGSLAALGEVMRLADQNASLSRDETEAQIIAASIMDELMAGYRAPTAVSQEVYDPDASPLWLYSIAVEPTNFQELVAVRVLVEQQLEAELKPARYELLRWVLNPEFVPEDTGEDESSSSSSSSSGSSSGSSSNSSSSSFGGGAGVP